MSARHDLPAGSPSDLVMVVDDDDASREIVHLLLDGEGYRVASYASPAAALAAVERHPDELAVLLTDVHMPGMSGPELATRVRVACPWVHVAFITGDRTPPRHVAGHFLRKPVDLDAILRFVAASLSTQATVRSPLAGISAHSSAPPSSRGR